MSTSIKLKNAKNVIHLPFEFCIVCGTSQQSDVHAFEQEDDHPLAHVAKLAGDVGSLAAELILNKSHKIEARFCRKCIPRYRSVHSRRQLFGLFFLLVIFVSILASTYIYSFSSMNTSMLVFGIGICIAIGFRIYGRYYAWKNSPKITRVTNKKLILKVPGRGKIICQR